MLLFLLYITRGLHPSYILMRGEREGGLGYTEKEEGVRERHRGKRSYKEKKKGEGGVRKKGIVRG